jgi:heme/copper-type cytochrome/quinol oxidase subunit 1
VPGTWPSPAERPELVAARRSHPVLDQLVVPRWRAGWLVGVPAAGIAGPPGMLGYQMTIIVFAFSTGVASVNLMVTTLTMRAKGMTWSRTPILVYGVFAAALMGLYAFPFYQYSQILALSDRIFNTSFFDPLEGGSVWLYENLFWLLGHPEVYVIIIPSAAVLMEILPGLLPKAVVLLQLRRGRHRRCSCAQRTGVGAPHVHDRLGALR